MTWIGQIEVRHISEGRNLETIADRLNLLLMMDRKSYMVFHLATFILTWSELERSNRGQAYFLGL